MRKIILSLVVLATSGCGSTMESLQMSNTQNLLIQTPHVEGAECKVSDKGGRKWNLRETPGTVAVMEGHPPLVIICSKKGFKTSVLTINEHKEELLMIDGKHIDVSIYGDFPTKFPRLIPAAVKETAGFVQDPTGSISTTYPNAITVWMEPRKWESEDQMREWAFDREVEDRAEFIHAEDAKSVDEKRKAVRRADSEKRDKKFQNFTKNLKRGVNPAEPLQKGFNNTTKMLNPTNAIEGVYEDGVGNPIPPIGKAISKGASGVATPVEKIMNDGVRDTLPPASALGVPNTLKVFNERNAAKEKTRQQRILDDAAPKSKGGSKYPSLEDPIDDDASTAPRDIFNDKPKYKKIYNGSDGNAVYDENGNRIAK